MITVRDAVRHFTHKGHVPEATATTGLGIDEDRSVEDIAEALEGRSQRLVRRPAAQATDEHLSHPSRGVSVFPGI